MFFYVYQNKQTWFFFIMKIILFLPILLAFTALFCLYLSCCIMYSMTLITVWCMYNNCRCHKYSNNPNSCVLYTCLCSLISEQTYRSVSFLPVSLNPKYIQLDMNSVLLRSEVSVLGREDWLITYYILHILHTYHRLFITSHWIDIHSIGVRHILYTYHRLFITFHWMG